MLNDVFYRLQNRRFYDSRDYPVKITEKHSINGPITEDTRKIKLGERVFDFDDVLLARIVKSASAVSLRLIHYESIAFYGIPFDLTVDFLSYDATTDNYYFSLHFFRGDNFDTWSTDYTLNGGIGENHPIVIDALWGKMTLVIDEFSAGAMAVITMIAYGNEVIVVDSLNVFAKRGDVNALYFNVPSNSIVLNDLPYPWKDGYIDVLIRYRGLGSIIRAEDLNDIVDVVKYYNLLPKFDIVKNNNNDIKLTIRGEYYYLGSHIEKYETQTIQIEDEILIGQQNVLVGYLDIPNNIFGVRRIATASNYNLVIDTVPDFEFENPDVETPVFIMVFDSEKNIYEYAYIQNRSGGSGGGLNKYSVTIDNATHVVIPMATENPPVVAIYGSDGKQVFADSVEWIGNNVIVDFLNPQSGTVVVIN